MNLLTVYLNVSFRNPEILAVNLAPDGVASQGLWSEDIVQEVIFINDNFFVTIVTQICNVESLIGVNFNCSDLLLVSD